jgi:glycosyltransferase involved in cell wall biosynthesis
MIIPKVSVIIPTRNRARMLRRAILSVLAQTWEGTFELIVVSDGSSDDSEEVVASFKDQRIRFIRHKTSRGPSAARNTGLRAARGQYIAFLDDDDEWTPNKLEVQMPVIENSGPRVGLVYAWMQYFQDRKPIRVGTPKLRGDIFVEMLDNQAIAGCPTIIIKRKVIDTVGYFDGSLPRGNDGDYWRRISKHYHVDYVPEVLAKIHVGHADRISVNSRENLRHAMFALEKRLKDFAGDFAHHPQQEACVMAQIAINAFKTGQFRKGIAFLSCMARSGASWRHKACLLLKVAKSIVK